MTRAITLLISICSLCSLANAIQIQCIGDGRNDNYSEPSQGYYFKNKKVQILINDTGSEADLVIDTSPVSSFSIRKLPNDQFVKNCALYPSPYTDAKETIEDGKKVFKFGMAQACSDPFSSGTYRETLFFKASGKDFAQTGEKFTGIFTLGHSGAGPNSYYVIRMKECLLAQ